MCTAGFWKNSKGTIHYFKNRMLHQMPIILLAVIMVNYCFIKAIGKTPKTAHI